MRLTIHAKIMFGIGLVILVMILANAYLLLQLDLFSDTLRVVLSSSVRSIDAARQVVPLIDDEERHARKYLGTSDTLYAALFTDVAARSHAHMEAMARHAASPEEMTLLRDALRTHAAVRRSIENISPTDGRPADPRSMEEAIADSIDAVRASINRVIAVSEGAIGASIRNLDAATEDSLNVAILVTLATLAASLIAAFLIARTITRPLTLLRTGTRRVARGDFRPIAVNSRDEIAQLAAAFNDMSTRLKLSNDQRTEMLHQISHEIRTPLQAIYSAYFILTRQTTGPVTAEQRKLLETVRENVNRIADFSNRFLELAKIESGMMQFSFQTADLAATITPAVENARVSAAARGIRIPFTALPAPPAHLDTDTILLVANNLLSNAIKYTPGGGTVAVTVEPSNGGVRLSVRDTGVGIPEQDIPKLFKKFSQASNTAPSGARGTGLGLALVKAIVEEHGGHVGVSSAPGSGSTFTVDLPAAGDSVPASDSTGGTHAPN